MGIIQLYDRRKYTSPVTRIIFKKSVENYILPRDYTSFDICCVGGGASGMNPIGYLTSIGSPYNDYTWSEAYRGYSIGSQGGPGGYVITKKQITLDEQTPISVNVGKGGVMGAIGWYGYKMDKVCVQEITNMYLRDRVNGSYTYNYWGINTTLTPTYNYIGQGEKSFVKDIKKNIILCEALGGSPPLFNNVTGDSYESVRQYRHTHTPPGINVSDSLRKDVATKNLNHYGGGNPGGYYLLNTYKGGTKGNYTTNNTDPNYYLNPYDVWTVIPRSQIEMTKGYKDAGRTRHIFEYTPPNPSYISYNFSKIDGQNLFGLGITTIMNEEKEQALSGGGSTVPYFGDFVNEQEGFSTDSISDDWKGEDGGGDGAIIKKLVPAGTYLTDISQIEYTPATDGKPNTGGGGGGGFAISAGTAGLSTEYDIKIPPGNGGSGIVIIDCYEKDYRPQTRVVGRIIIVE